MAKVKIQGHASGTGVITVTAPNTSTDRTITLPDATGTLLNSDGSGANLTSLPADATKVPLAGGTMTGNLGIGGTADSGKQLHIEGDGTDVGITLKDTAGVQYSIKSDANNFTIRSDSAAVDRLTITADGRGLSQFTAKAWINFNGTGTIAIRDSHNISSIVDGGTGYYTVNIDVDMANANYALSVASGRNDTSSGYHEICWIAHGTYPAASNFVLSTGTSHHAGVTGGTQQDHHTVCAVVFGD